MSSEKRRLKPEDLFNFALPGDAQISPDGTQVVFVVQTFDEKENKNRTCLFIADANGESKPRRLTAGKNDRLPRWAPDGSRLAFVSDRGEKAQLYIIDPDGGEAWRLPTSETIQSEPVWRPDGQCIAFVSQDFSKPPEWKPYEGAPEGDYKRARRQAEAQLKQHDKGDDDYLTDVKVITDFRFRFDGIGYFGDRKKQLYVVDVPADPPGPGEELEDMGATKLTDGDFDHENPAWSPDGTSLLCTSVRKELAWEDLSRQDLWVVDVDSGNMTQLLDGQGPVFAPAWSPDGRSIAFVGNDRRFGGSTSNDLWLMPAAPGDAPLTHEDCLNLTRSFDRPVGTSISTDMRYSSGRWTGAEWVGTRLYFLAGDRGAAGIFACDTEGLGDGSEAEIHTIVEPARRSVGGFSVSAIGSVAFQSGTADTTEDIYLVRDGTQELRLTAMNEELLEELALTRSEKFSFKGPDEWEIDGWMLKPPGYEEGRAYPTVLFIHGGPHGVYGDAFMFQMQLVAATGKVVVYTNPRGSQTYGQDFAYAVVADWGGKDYEDIMAGVDALVQRGVADPDRLGVTGWSYGGFMTNWVITQTTRFRAAVAGACVANRHNFYGTSDIGFTFGEHHWKGNPWENPDRLLERSPLQYVDRVETPLLLVHGEGDLRCPIEQSDQMYIALKRQGKPVVYTRYPDEFHGFTQPLHRLDRYERLVAWFEHYLA